MKNRIPMHDNWITPSWLYAELDAEFNFNFDPCPYSEGEPLFDGLKVDWGSSSYVNPPYSRKLKEGFINKGLEEAKKGKLVVLLLPVSTSTKIFHEVILPNATEIRFFKGRVRFEGYNGKGVLVTNKTGMHDSMLVIFDRSRKNANLINVEKNYARFN